MLEFKESPEPDEFAREKGRKLFVGNVDFLKGVVDMNGLPPADRRSMLRGKIQRWEMS